MDRGERLNTIRQSAIFPDCLPYVMMLDKAARCKYIWMDCALSKPPIGWVFRLRVLPQNRFETAPLAYRSHITYHMPFGFTKPRKVIPEAIFCVSNKRRVRLEEPL